LRKFIYNPPNQFSFKGLGKSPATPAPGLDGSRNFSLIHPVASLINPLLGLPEDLNLEPRDCFRLWEAMKKYSTPKFPLPNSLNPKELPDVIKKKDIFVWESNLKLILSQWMTCDESPFKQVKKELSSSVASLDTWANVEQLGKSTLPMLSELHAQDALPALLFSYDRELCEKTAQSLLKDLEGAEDEFKKTESWQTTIAKFARWQEEQGKRPSVAKKAKRKRGDKETQETSSSDNRQRGPRDGGSHRENSQSEGTIEGASAEYSKWATFDPNAPVEGFHFANWKKLLPSEFKEFQDELNWRGIPKWLITALSRGIGVHHAGMNRKYRQTVEMLFRKGFLRVVIATGTLSLGINMPCKTVVFSGDTIYLTALNYRQSGGRAGRRGFDVLGNIVFQGIPTERVFKIMSSRLPDLHGHFPLTTSLVLRLCILLNETNNSHFAVHSINAILEQPRLCLGSSESKTAVLHHLRFSIEYLRRQYLLDSTGAPINLAGLVSHLYYTDNSCWGFHALFKSGYFHSLCSNIHQDTDNVCLTLMLVMAHLFCRRKIARQDSQFLETVRRSSSIVFLPPLPREAEEVLQEHNTETLEIFTNYVDTYVNQHLQEHPDNKLPLTGLTIGPSATTPLPSFSKPPTTIRSAFVATSGHGDSFSSISELCRTVRSGVFLEEAVVPHLKLTSEGGAPLNAYLYDFYKHGDKHSLERVNCIRANDLWFFLNDFSLVLATITTSLTNLMKGSENDVDMADIQGDADALEEQKEDLVDESWEQKANKIHDDLNMSNLKDALEDKALKEAVLDSPTLEDKAAEKKDSSRSASRDSGDSGKEPIVPSWEDGADGGLRNILTAFELLQTRFNAKFRAIWA
jgi:ATP-dependent RNA helicase DDX60